MKEINKKNLLLMVTICILVLCIVVFGGCSNAIQGECQHKYEKEICKYCRVHKSAENLEYLLNDDGKSYTVVGSGDFNGYSLEINWYKNLPVTAIEGHVFWNCDNLVSITIGKNVKEILNDGWGAYKLVEVINYSPHITVTKGSEDNGNLGRYALFVYNGSEKQTSKVTNDNGCIVFSDGDDRILMGYHGENGDVVVPDYVTKIHRLCCEQNLNLTSIVIPDSVTSIGDGAFWNCYNLMRVVIGDGVTTIERNTFATCANLTSITFGKNVRNIDDGAFTENYRLVEIINYSFLWIEKTSGSFGRLGDNALSIYNGDEKQTSKVSDDNGYIIYSDGDDKILTGYLGKETELVVPDYVTEINDYALYNCFNLTSVTIPDGVTSIGDNAFYCSENLISVTIPDSVVSIGESAFEDCIDLKEVMIPDKVTIIRFKTFNRCLSLSKVVLGKNITEIGGYAFSSCDSLTNVTIPNSVTQIGRYAFWGANLISVTMGNGVTQIGENAFGACFTLVEVINYSSHITVTKESEDNGKLGQYALFVYNGSAEQTSRISDDNGYMVYSDGDDKILVKYVGVERDLVVPDYVTEINGYAFRVAGLTSITIPESVKKINRGAFTYCSNLKSVKIGNGVTSIEDNAFSNCYNLLYLAIPDSVTKIGDEAFSGCRGLISVTVGKGVTQIGENAFGACFTLVEVINYSPHITVTKGSEDNGNLGRYALFVYNGSEKQTSKITNDNGCIIFSDGDDKILIEYLGDEKELIIPDYVTEIKEYAFMYIGFTSITIPDSVKKINSAAFYESYLGKLTIGRGVTEIGDDAFCMCQIGIVYYRGTQSDWNNIVVGKDNEILIQAPRFYNSGKD